jgi:hypothetical protein
MFAKDIELLNKLYNESVNLGPLGDQDPGVGLSPSKPSTIKMPVKRKCLKCANCAADEECEHADFDENNADMSKQSLFRIFKLSAMLHDLICREEQVEPWVLAKITEALQHLEAVFGYKDYEHYKHQVETDIQNIGEETEHDLYDTIAAGGSDLVNKIRDVLTNESKENLEKVLYETITILEKKN